MELQLIISFIISYLLGSVPFAKLIVKVAAKKDIINEGTGNAGAMNSYEITGKKWIGLSVFAADAAKGAAAVLISYSICPDFLCAGVAAVGVVAGHNFSLFLKFKGGRGLAAALGATLLFNPLAGIIWALMWVAGFFIFGKTIYAGNIVATVTTPIMLFSTPPGLFLSLNLYVNSQPVEYRLLLSVVCVLILLRHIEPLKELLLNKDK